MATQKMIRTKLGSREAGFGLHGVCSPCGILAALTFSGPVPHCYPFHLPWNTISSNGFRGGPAFPPSNG